MPADALPPTAAREAPWLAGLQAARANVIPGLLVQGIMLALLLAYYFYPPTTHGLNELASLKGRWGYGYSAISAIVAGALFPELLQVVVFQKGKVLRRNSTNLLFSIPFWCLMGVLADFLYRCQAGWFGTAILYDWKNSGYGMGQLRTYLSAGYYQAVVIPTLFATWGVWIPIVSILYSLPPLLQVPLFGLALSLWVMLYTWMSEQRKSKG